MGKRRQADAELLREEISLPNAHDQPDLLSATPTAARIVGGVVGFGFAGIGLTVLIFLWAQPFNAWDSPPIFFRIFGSFIALMFIVVGGAMGVTTLLARSLPLRSLGGPKAANSTSEGQHKCRNCGAPLPSGAEVSPLGDVRCPFCKTWMNVHGRA